MMGSNFKYTQFVFHEPKHAKPPVQSFKCSLSFSSRPTATVGLCLVPLHGHMLKVAYSPQRSRAWPGSERAHVKERMVCPAGWCCSHCSTVKKLLPHKTNTHRDARWAGWRHVPQWVPARPCSGVGCEQSGCCSPQVDGFTQAESLHQTAWSPLWLREGSDSPDPPSI